MRLLSKLSVAVAAIINYRRGFHDIGYCVTSTRAAAGTNGEFTFGPVEASQWLSRAKVADRRKAKKRKGFGKFRERAEADPIQLASSIKEIVYESDVSEMAYQKTYKKVLENQFEVWWDENKGVVKRLFPEREYYQDVAVAIQYIAHELKYGDGNQRDENGEKIPGKKLGSVLQDCMSLKQAIKRKYRVKDNLNAFAHGYIRNFKKQHGAIFKRIQGALHTSHAKLTDHQHFHILANAYRPDILNAEGKVIKKSPLASLRDKYDTNCQGHVQKALCWRTSEVMTLDWSDLKKQDVIEDGKHRVEQI